MNHYDKIYVGASWVSSTSSKTIPVVNPATEEVIAAVSAGSAEDVEKAVAAARQAFPSWSATAPAERAEYLAALADILDARKAEIGAVISADLGAPRTKGAVYQASGGPNIRSYVETAERYAWEETAGPGTIVRVPVGVVAAIAPWNAPVLTPMDKIAPALLAGCTVIFKPSEVAPLAAYAITEAIHEVGLPTGVFNLVSGPGETVGEALVQHPGVDMISFTGSTRAGSRIGSVAAGRTARFLLELGGKSANIVLDDADLDVVLKASVLDCFSNSGQICTSPTRLLIDRSRYAEAVEQIKTIAEQVTVGDPNTDVDLGPLVSGAQRDRVRGYIAKGIAEGARLVTGGPTPPEGLEKKGFYVRPTVFADVKNSMTIAQEEIFGPVLSVIPYEDEDDAVRIANDSAYGLSGQVWSADPARARQVARRMRTGQVAINGRRPGKDAPFGGFKHSGVGRSHGRFALDEYVEIQAINAEEL